jgi:hypothetical protein
MASGPSEAIGRYRSYDLNELLDTSFKLEFNPLKALLQSLVERLDALEDCVGELGYGRDPSGCVGGPRSDGSRPQCAKNPLNASAPTPQPAADRAQVC